MRRDFFGLFEAHISIQRTKTRILITLTVAQDLTDRGAYQVKCSPAVLSSRKHYIVPTQYNTKQVRSDRATRLQLQLRKPIQDQRPISERVGGALPCHLLFSARTIIAVRLDLV